MLRDNIKYYTARARRAGEVLFEKGPGELARKVCRQIGEVVCCPWAKSRLRVFNRKTHTIPELLDFAYGLCWGIIRPVQDIREISRLLEILERERPRVFLEIGTSKGGTLFLFSHVSAADSLIISVDMPYGEYGAGYAPWRRSLYGAFVLPGQKVRLIRGNSHDDKVAERVKGILGGDKLDFLFIDGDHSYDGVKKDFEKYGPLVKKGGLAVFHDIHPNLAQPDFQVKRYWDEIKGAYEYKEILGDEYGDYNGIGLLRM